VSSANNIVILSSFMVLGKLLTYMRNNSGPQDRTLGNSISYFFQ
jgi:hypothetical protein